MTSVAKLCESPADRAERFLSEINANQKEQYGRVEIQHLLKGVIGAGDLWNGLRRIETIQRGDVFIAKVVGGKIRPWIALSSKAGVVSAVAMSSGDRAPRMIKSKARYWAGSWISATVSLFEEAEVRDRVSLPYNNRDHLREIEAHCARELGLRA